MRHSRSASGRSNWPWNGCVEFSPYWNVPPSIQRNELVPKLARDLGYLVREDTEIVGSDRGAPPHTSVADPLALAQLMLRDRPEWTADGCARRWTRKGSAGCC